MMNADQVADPTQPALCEYFRSSRREPRGKLTRPTGSHTPKTEVATDRTLVTTGSLTGFPTDDPRHQIATDSTPSDS
jgi:hypothetical protein